jgi:hypothetical protein
VFDPVRDQFSSITIKFFLPVAIAPAQKNKVGFEQKCNPNMHCIPAIMAFPGSTNKSITAIKNMNL